MKYILTLLFTGILLSGCNKKSEELKAPPIDSSTTVADSLRKFINSMDKNQSKTSRGALEEIIRLDHAGPIPPHILPIKDVTLLEKTDSTASYALTSGSIAAKIKVDLKRTIKGTDTTWMHTKIEDLP